MKKGEERELTERRRIISTLQIPPSAPRPRMEGELMEGGREGGREGKRSRA